MSWTTLARSRNTAEVLARPPRERKSNVARVNLQRDYDVTISVRGIANFKSKTGDVEYWIATEQGSKVEK